MVELKGDKNISELPAVGIIVKDGSSYDVPLIIGIFILIIIVAFATLLGIFFYCRFGRQVGICETCW